MKGISDLKIIGMDPARPPIINKKPYIELFFKLNHKAPLDWLGQFNDQMAKGKYPIKIRSKDSAIIETWVREVSEIEPVFIAIQQAIKTCIDNYLNRLAALQNAEQANQSGATLSPAQIELNTVIASLKFDKED